MVLVISGHAHGLWAASVVNGTQPAAACADGPARRDADMRIRYPIGADESPSVALVRVVAELIGAGPLEMAPLGRLIDLEGLDRLLTDSGSEPMSVAVQLGFMEHRFVVDPTEIVVEIDDEAIEGDAWPEVRREAPR